MKILHVVVGYPIGTHPFELWQLRGAIDLGHQVTLIAANHGNAAGLEMAAQLKLPPDLCTYANARTYPVLNANPRRLLPRIARAADKARYGRVLAEQRKSFFCDLLSRSALRDIDLVQAHFLSWAIEVGIPLARLLQRPCVVTAHSAIDDTPTESLQYIQREADAVILVSDAELDAFAARTDSRHKLHRIWNGVPLPPSPSQSKATKSDRPLRLVCAGRLDPAKRVLDIIEALPQLAAAGAVPHAHIMDAFASADLLVHASAMESFGMVMVEARAREMPVVAAASAGARDIALHDATGVMFPIGDVTGLVASVRRLAQDVALRRTMGAAAHQRAEPLFLLKAHMRNINTVWNAVVTSPR